MTRTRDKYALSALLMFVGLSVTSAARAQVHFTTPIPSFEESRASAKQEGKPLLIEFSATWCGPCKSLARELKKARAKPALDQVHMVVYNGEEEPGLSLMQKFGVSGFPSFIAVDDSGEEAVRETGFGRWADFEEFLKGLPEKALTLDAQRKAADRSPGNGQLQIVVANRLLKLDRYDEAQTYFLRAQKTGPKDVSAQAAWVLLQLASREQQHKTIKPVAMQLVTKYPGSKEATKALRYLATIPGVPAPALETLLAKQLDEAKDASALNSLAFIAMKARAFTTAVRVGQKLEPLAKEKASYLDTLAEIAFFAEARADKAIALEERAIAAASFDDKARYAANLERYRRNQKEASSSLLDFSTPSLDPQSERRRPYVPSATSKLRTSLGKELRERCWQAAGTSDGVELIVLAAAQPAEHRVLASSNVAPSLLSCATKIIQATEMPAGEIITLSPEFLPKTFEDQLDEARGVAEESCATKASKGTRLRAVLRADAGKNLAVHFASEVPGKLANHELETCIEQNFITLKAPRPILRTTSFEFSNE